MSLFALQPNILPSLAAQSLRNIGRLAGVFLFLLAWCQPASAQFLTVVDNYGSALESDPVAGNSIPIADPFAGNKAGAVSFTVAQDTTVVAASIYVQSDSPLSFDGTFGYYIFGNDSSPIAHPATTPILAGSTGAFTSETLSNVSCIVYLDKLTFDFSTPVNLLAGTTYWFAISGESPGTTGGIDWDVPEEGGTFYGVPALTDGTWTSSWSSGLASGDPAFKLYAQPTLAPEPKPLDLVLMGSIGIGLLEFIRRRRALLSSVLPEY